MNIDNVGSTFGWPSVGDVGLFTFHVSVGDDVYSRGCRGDGLKSECIQRRHTK